MLEAADKDLSEASADDRGRAETLAASWLVTQYEQDLIPTTEARRIVDEHRAGDTKEWVRAVYAALVGLRAVGR